MTILVSTGLILALSLPGCIGGESESGEHDGGESAGEHGGSAESGEHDGEGESDGDGEESGTQYGLNETFDEVRAGARLALSYDSAANAFTGTVENTTGATLRRIRVEVHLSNGTELGPTTPTDLAPGEVASASRFRQPVNPSQRGAPTLRWGDSPAD